MKVDIVEGMDAPLYTRQYEISAAFKITFTCKNRIPNKAAKADNADREKLKPDIYCNLNSLNNFQDKVNCKTPLTFLSDAECTQGGQYNLPQISQPLFSFWALSVPDTDLMYAVTWRICLAVPLSRAAVRSNTQQTSASALRIVISHSQRSLCKPTFAISPMQSPIQSGLTRPISTLTGYLGAHEDV
jgi:hypothetical protein